MIKFQVEDKNPAVLVGLVESAGMPCLTINGIQVAYLSPYTGRLGTCLLSDREERQLRILGVHMKDGRIAVA